MPREAQPALHAGQNRLGHARHRALAAVQPARGDEHQDKAGRAREQRAAGTDPGGDAARQRRPDRARNVECDSAEGDRAWQFLARHEIVDAGCLRRPVEREPGADDKREHQQDRRADQASERGDAENRGCDQQHVLRADDQSPPIDDIGERAGNQSEREDRVREFIAAIPQAATVVCIV